MSDSIRKNDLVAGKIYRHKNGTIVKWNGLNGGNHINPFRKTLNVATSGSYPGNDLYESTPEEKHWLETCIKEDKFISKEEAMETFKPLVGKYFIPLYNDLDCSDCKINKYYRIESEDNKYIWSVDA
jgi:hypothetical protein